MRSPSAPGRLALRRPQALVLALALFVAGMATRDLLLPDPAPRATRPATAPPSDTRDAGLPGPRTTTAGVPAGFSHTPEGAVAAAVGYVGTGQTLLDMAPLTAEQAVRQMASDGSADALVAETGTKLASARRALEGSQEPVVYHQAALAVRVGAFTPERARVDVWNVGVLSRDGVAPPQASWATSSFELVWERDDWRIWSETITPGPTPILSDAAVPVSSAQLDAALAGFSSYGMGR